METRVPEPRSTRGERTSEVSTDAGPRINGEMEATNSISMYNGGSESVKGKKKHGGNGMVSGGPVIMEQKVKVFEDRRTRLIVKLLFGELNPTCGRHLPHVQRELVILNSSSDVKLVKETTVLIIQMLRETNTISINLEDFRNLNWNLHAGNTYAEFSRVAQETFSDSINWGRVLVFLGFCVSYSLYLEKLKVAGGSLEESVMEWTCQVIREDLGQFYLSHGGWEGFESYLKIALSAAKKRRTGSSVAMVNGRGGEGHDGEEQGGSMWNGAMAAGAVAVGAMAVFTLRQAFS